MGIDGKVFKQKYGKEISEILADPQGLNSYAYARNNPLKYNDPTGEWFAEFMTGRQSWPSFQTEVGMASNYLYNNSSVWHVAMDHPVGTGVVVGVGGGAAAYVGAAALTGLSVQYLGGAGTGCLMGCSQVINKSSNYISRYGSQVGSKMDQITREISNKGYNFSDHSIQRMAERNISSDKVLQIMQNTKPFEFFHDNTVKMGFYDKTTQLFVSQAKGGAVLTVINNVSQNYIKNLINK